MYLYSSMIVGISIRSDNRCLFISVFINELDDGSFHIFEFLNVVPEKTSLYYKSRIRNIERWEECSRNIRWLDSLDHELWWLIQWLCQNYYLHPRNIPGTNVRSNNSNMIEPYLDGLKQLLIFPLAQHTHFLAYPSQEDDLHSQYAIDSQPILVQLQRVSPVQIPSSNANTTDQRPTDDVETKWNHFAVQFVEEAPCANVHNVEAGCYFP